MRLSTIFFVLSVILFLPALVSAEDKRLRVNRDEALPLFESVIDTAQAELMIPIPILVEQLNLKLFDAADGELSICLGEAPCLYFAQQIKAWRCASNVCEQGDGAARSAGCFADQFRNYTSEDQAKIGQSVCSIVKSPSKEARISLLEAAPDISEHVLAENTAYLWAFKKNVDQCVAVIKDYVGEFGPNWNFRWYRALSGCRILAQESTRQKEEKDFFTWLSVERGSGKCEEIKDSILKDACKTPEAPSPKPGFEFLPGISQLDAVSIRSWVDVLELNVFAAAKVDESFCRDDKFCLQKAKTIKNWYCTAKTCESGDVDKEPGLCFKEFYDNSTQEVRQQINEVVCLYFKTPNSQTRQNLSKIASEGLDNDSLVQVLAHISALSGSAKLCQDIIKSHVGEYGSLWSPSWYVALSGCRILAGESNLDQEEKDFSHWLTVEGGFGNCSRISNPELRAACSAPGATFPKVVYEKK